MSWFVDSSLTYFQQFCMNVIKYGPIPRHVAFIMDGNRRYATKMKTERGQGHVSGFNKLAETLRWCQELGISEVTVYAFSIENFKRSKEEVDQLMQLALEKFQRLLDERDKIMAEGICVRVLGNFALFPDELRKVVSLAMLMTKNNKKAFLNIAFAYTSRDEIVNSVKTVVEAVDTGLITVNDINEDLISECLYTNESPDPDIIIRTSGEVRFSDYLLWQISNSYICFTEVLWPEFSIWNFLACIFKYQRCYNELQKRKCINKEKNDRIKNFLEELNEQRLVQLETYLA